MKPLKYIALPILLFMSILTAGAAEHKVVFELTSDDQKIWETLLNNVENVRKELGAKTQMEVVVHGNGIGLLLKKSNFQKERIQKQTKEGVNYVACENTMKRKKVGRSDIYDFVGTVPAGLAEIIRKQQEGWAYIKIGH
jgi:uncharacterized protein